MQKRILYFLCLIFGFVCINAHAQKVTTNKQAVNLDIYLLIGQSNMAGRADVKGNDKDTLVNVFLFKGVGEEEWEKAANPLNKYSSIRKSMKMQKLGPGYSFAREIAKSDQNKQIGLVVNAKGGTKIEQWAPGTEFYTEAVERTKAALKCGTLKGIIWHQGEANSSKYKQYTPKIIELVEALRTDFGNSDLPFIAGQLSKDKPQRKKFNRMIKKLPRHLDNCGVVSSKKLSTIDNTHFDSKSQCEFGERYARKMLAIQAKKN